MIENVKVHFESRIKGEPLTCLVDDSIPVHVAMEDTFSLGEIADAVKEIIKTHMRKTVLETQSRLDGRKPNEVRPVRATAPILPRTHGSALFERGVTQVLSIRSLGGP